MTRKSKFDIRWEKKWTELAEYKKSHGHCNVPQTDKHNHSLAVWVTMQRDRKDTLSHERIEKLEKLGFEWNPHENTWRQRISQLEKFKQKEGHCKVPKNNRSNKELAGWVRSCRMRKERLTIAQLADLERVGLELNPKEAQWNRMFQALVTFKKEHGHCLVPQHYKDDPSLGLWVTKQRTKKESLSQERRRKLENIGFVWRTKPGRKPTA